MRHMGHISDCCLIYFDTVWCISGVIMVSKLISQDYEKRYTPYFLVLALGFKIDPAGI